MFILLGDVMLESRLAIKMLDVMNKWLGGFRADWPC